MNQSPPDISASEVSSAYPPPPASDLHNQERRGKLGPYEVGQNTMQEQFHTSYEQTDSSTSFAQPVSRREAESTSPQSLLSKCSRAETKGDTAPLSPKAKEMVWEPENYTKNSSSQQTDATNLAEKVLEHFKITPPIGPILDLGCGTGRNLSTYPNIFLSKTIYAVDKDQRMLDAVEHSSNDGYRIVKLPPASAADFCCSTKDEKPKVILTSHVIHWIDGADLRPSIQNIYNQLAEGGYLAAFYAASKEGLPFQTALNGLKCCSEFKDPFSGFLPTQHFHQQEVMEDMLSAVGFTGIVLNSDYVKKEFDSREKLLGFVQQWLPEYNHLKRIDRDLADSFLNQLIDNYIKITKQEGLKPIQWCEKSFTLFAYKPKSEHSS